MKYLLVGLGNIGAKRKAVLGDRCVATVDPHNLAADFRSFEAPALDGFDAVVAAVPNDVKVPLLRYFLSKGKHVLIEKPLILTEEEGAELQALSRVHRAICYTSYNFRFEPQLVAMKQHLAAGTLGEIYRVRMFYGNGTAGNLAGSWRDTPLGVLEDMASHLIDLSGFVFGRAGGEFRVWERHGYELKYADHAILATSDRALVIEVSFLSWKNRWRIEVTGRLGSMEMDGLTKWGDSELVVRRRKLPSGAPEEHRTVVHGPPDPTWPADIAHFEARASALEGSLDNDLWLSRVIAKAAVAPLGGGS